jgi:ABC-type sugar transport system substrate-binding protein
MLFLTPATQEGFYDTLLIHLLKATSGIANTDQQMMIMPLVPHGKIFQDPELITENQMPKNISGIFIIPGNPDTDQNKNRIKALNADKRPVVLIDVNIGTVNLQDESLPHFVGGNEVSGGRIAAELADGACRKFKIENPMVQIITGRATEWENQRYIFFKEELKKKIPTSVFLHDSEPLDYRKDKAKNWMERKIRSLRSENSDKPIKLDIIFACNDAMALGALEAIEEAKEKFKQSDLFVNTPLIIGYDGTEEMMSLQKSGNPHLVGTVMVDIEEQATRAVAMMSMLLKGHKPPTKMYLVEPRPQEFLS